MVDLNASVRSLSGIGPARAQQLLRLQIETVADLLYHFPRGYQDRTPLPSLSCAQDGQVAAVVLTVGTAPKLARLRGRLSLLQFRAFDQSATCTVTYFGQEFLAKEFAVGGEYRFYGKIKKKGNRFELTSPTHEQVLPEVPLGTYRAVYPLTQGLTQKFLRNALLDALSHTDLSQADPLPKQIRTSYGLPDLAPALRAIHFPQNQQQLQAAQRRFAFQELFLFCLGICHQSQRTKKGNAPAICANEARLAPFLQALPYSLTAAQRRSITEIASDLQAPNGVPMARLLNGDVGSGKTICAAAAAYLAIQSGLQCAFMVPTEILARQHYCDLCDLFSSLGIRCALLCGSMSAAQKRAVTTDLQSHQVDLVIGTHALLNDTVQFAKLGLVITDEQHRFGVFQRTTLAQKATDVHVLVMSATPIPRTLALVLYGDLALSTLDELPPGRQAVDTFFVDNTYRSRLLSFMEKQVQQGHQVYVVCPAIEEQPETEQGELTPSLRPQLALPMHHAVSYAQALSQALAQCRIGLLHGKMKGAQKDEVMQAFVAKELDILVSTTVIEVGVNVPNATLMVVENAERFGLSQLHQLRGRVGRGNAKSVCVLVSDSQEPAATQRLQTLCHNRDGYAIAKADLAMRGPGNFFPDSCSDARQSGQLRLRFANLCDDMDLLLLANESARALFAQDPALTEYPATKKALSTLWQAHRNTFH